VLTDNHMTSGWMVGWFYGV